MLLVLKLTLAFCFKILYKSRLLTSDSLSLNDFEFILLNWYCKESSIPFC